MAVRLRTAEAVPERLAVIGVTSRAPGVRGCGPATFACPRSSANLHRRRGRRRPGRWHQRAAAGGRNREIIGPGSATSTRTGAAVAHGLASFAILPPVLGRPGDGGEGDG